MKNYILKKILKFIRGLNGGINVQLQKRAEISARVYRNGSWGKKILLIKKPKICN